MLMLYRAGVSANQVTLVTFVSSIVMAGMLYYSPSLTIWFALPFFMLIRMAGNAIDGMLAKQHNKQTDFGFILNEVTDLLADAALLLAFSAVIGFDSYWLVSMLLLSWLSEFIALMGQVINGERQNSGPLGKSDRAVFLSIFAIMIGLNINSLELSFWFFIIGHFLLILTCINRVRQGLQE